MSSSVMAAVTSPSIRRCWACHMTSSARYDSISRSIVVVGLRSKIEIQLILYITVEYLHEPEAILASSRVGVGTQPFPPNVEQPKIFDFHDVDADAYTVFPRIASL